MARYSPGSPGAGLAPALMVATVAVVVLLEPSCMSVVWFSHL